jgi:hypothetical protein
MTEEEWDGSALIDAVADAAGIDWQDVLQIVVDWPRPSMTRALLDQRLGLDGQLPPGEALWRAGYIDRLSAERLDFLAFHKVP